MDTAEVVKKCRLLPGVRVKETEEYVELQLSSGEDRGRMRCLPVFPGITLAQISVQAAAWPAPVMDACTPEAKGPMIINYCTRGRCELVLNNHKSVFLTAGHIALTEKFARSEYVYPGRSYEGIELFIDPDIVDNGLPMLKNEFGVDITALRRMYCPEGETYIAKLSLPEEHMERLLDASGQEGLLKTINRKTGVIDLLAHLLYGQKQAAEPLVYFTRLQVEMARKIEAAITEDLSVTHRVKEFAVRFSVSESSVKKYFYGVYGQSIPQYTTQRRMCRAAELLSGTSMPVIEVAGAVGYENQSKFAAVFRRQYGLSPREYRQGQRIAHKE